MPSGSEYAARLGEEIRRSLARHLASLQEELEGHRHAFESSNARMTGSIEAIGAVDLTAAETLLCGAIEEVAEETRRDLSEKLERELSERLRREIGARLETEIAERLRGELTPRLEAEISERTRRELASESRADTAALAAQAAEIHAKETQEEILQALLEGARHHATRVALWVVRGEELTGWASRGYSESVAEKIRRTPIERSTSPFLARTLAAGTRQSLTESPADDALSSLVGSESAAPWSAFALHPLGRPVAVLFAASEPGRPCDDSALGLLLDLTALCIENLALKILREAGSPRPAEAAPAAAAPRISAPPMPPPAPAPPAPRSPEVPPRTPVPLEAREAAEPARRPPEPSEVPSRRLEAGGGPAADHAAAAASRAGAAGAPVPAAEPNEEEKLHADAKRFARLLISEIKLYNEKRVAEGRRNRDVYVRLKRDIDRSREMYEKRVSPLVARKFDYFHDELIRILGDNELAALGPDYPGPHVER